MTMQDFIQLVGQSPLAVLAVFVLLPVLARLCALLHGRGNGRKAPWKYCYAVLIYLVCVPGIFVAVLLAYELFFTRENLLDAIPLVCFLPIPSMIVTLIVIRASIAFDEVPGFARLSGFMVLIACSFALALLIDKTRIFLGFFGSIGTLLLLVAVLFLLLSWGANLLFRRRDEG